MSKRKILSLIVKFLVTFAFIIVLGFVSYYYISIGNNNKKVMSVDYNGSSDISYKVYLKKNNFFTEPYLDMDRTYIASLIDYIDVLFVYNMNYSSLVSGEYTYYVKATIMANKSNSRGSNTNYWEKSYSLTEPEKIEFDSRQSYIISKNVDIKYQEYSELLRQFRSEYGLAIDGILKLELVIESNVKNDDMSKNIVVNTSKQLSIPLTEQAIELSIDMNNNNDVGTVKDVVKLKDAKYTIYFSIGIILGIIDIGMLILMITVIVMIVNSKSLYIKTLNKIKSTYDSILVNVNEVPDLSDLNVIYVDSFQELIDAHSEVRMPINFIEEVKDNRSVFVLINDKIAWVYILEDENYEQRKR